MIRNPAPRVAFAGANAETRLTRALYVIVFVTGILASVGQLLVIPIFLDPRSFGLVIAGIAATQASVLLSDLGCIAIASNVLIPRSGRAELREAAYSISVFVVLICSAGLILARRDSADPDSVRCIIVGLLTGLPLMFARLKANACELSGDERGGLVFGWCWQNGPKLGMLVGAFTGSAQSVMWGGLISSLIICGLGIPKPAYLSQWIAKWRLGVVALALAITPYLMSWGDSFVLGLTTGLSDLGAYGFVYRIVFAVSYIYGPLLTVIAARSRNSPQEGIRGIKWFAALCIMTVPPVCLVAALLQGRVQQTTTSWLAVIFLGLAATSLAMSSVVGRLIIQWGDPHNAAAASGAAACAVVLTSFIAVPHFGVTGAALGSFIGMTVAFLWQLVAFTRLVRAHQQRNGG